MKKLVFNKKNQKLKFRIDKPIKQSHQISSFGPYPIPTGRILKRYAYKHDLMPLKHNNKKLIFNKGIVLPKKRINTPIIGEDDLILKKPLKKMAYHELVVHAMKKGRAYCPFGDDDGDGVVNMADCKPKDKRKQGPQHQKNKTKERNEYGDIIDISEYEQPQDSEEMHSENWHTQRSETPEIKRMPSKGRGVEIKSKNGRY